MEIDVKTTHVVEIETGIPMSNNNTDNYNSLTNKPQINGITLSGNKTAEELGLASKEDVEELSNNKVDKEYGKGLSTNDFTNEEKEKLSNLQNYDDTQVKQNINSINEKIPTQATNNNQLADKDFVNSSLNSITAFYITKNANGDQFNSKSELDSATEFYSGGEIRIPTRNDYCIVLEDETKDNSTTRYIYQNEQWEFQYVVNETALTSEQIKAINSGITLELVAKLQGLNNYDDTEIRQELDNKVDKVSFVYDEETGTLNIEV